MQISQELLRHPWYLNGSKELCRGNAFPELCLNYYTMFGRLQAIYIKINLQVPTSSYLDTPKLIA